MWRICLLLRHGRYPKLVPDHSIKHLVDPPWSTSWNREKKGFHRHQLTPNWISEQTAGEVLHYAHCTLTLLGYKLSPISLHVLCLSAPSCLLTDQPNPWTKRDALWRQVGLFPSPSTSKGSLYRLSYNNVGWLPVCHMSCGRHDMLHPCWMESVLLELW